MNHFFFLFPSACFQYLLLCICSLNKFLQNWLLLTCDGLYMFKTLNSSHSHKTFFTWGILCAYFVFLFKLPTHCFLLSTLVFQSSERPLLSFFSRAPHSLPFEYYSCYCSCCPTKQFQHQSLLQPYSLPGCTGSLVEHIVVEELISDLKQAVHALLGLLLQA